MVQTGNTANQLIQSLADGDMAVLDQIYKSYRDDFIRWASTKYTGINREDLIDAWHDTMIMFYDQVRDKKLTHLTCELKTFLFLIGSRRLSKMHKQSSRTDLVEETDANFSIAESINMTFEEDLEEEKKKILRAAIAELPEQSRRILLQRFIERKSVTEIMESMNYSSVSAISVTLSRALKRLKETIVERMATIK